MKSRIETIRISLDHVLRYGRLQLLVCHHNNDTTLIQSSTTSSTRHLNVLSRRKRSEISSIEFGDGSEDDGLGGHVESNGERLRREENLDESFLEQNLDDLLQNRQ